MALITKIDGMNIIYRASGGKSLGHELPIVAWRCDHGYPTEKLFMGSDVPVEYGSIKEAMVDEQDVLDILKSMSIPVAETIPLVVENDVNISCTYDDSSGELSCIIRK